MHPGIDANELVEVSQEDLSRASLLKTPQQVLAIFEQPQYTLDPEAVRSSLCLALDDVQDPGNLGTLSVWPTGLASNILSARRIR